MPFQAISPSRYAGMKDCLLREALANAKTEPKLPSSPKGAIGSISHRLIEESSKGQVGPERRSFELRWDELVANAENHLPTFQRPLSKSCAEFGIARSRAVRAAERCHNTLGRVLGQGRNKAYGAELDFQTRDGFLRGRIDLVIPSEKGPVIQDFKTGEILDSETNEIKQAYDLQLKLYAAIYADSTNVWPDRAELISIDGHSFSVEIDKGECLRLLDQARAFFHSSNSLLERIVRGVIPASDAARPSPQACRYCSYRPYCSTYLGHEQNPNEEGAWPHDIIGTIDSVRQGPNDRLICSVKDRKGETNVIRRLTKLRYPPLLLGSAVGFFSVKRENAPQTYREGASTAVFS